MERLWQLTQSPDLHRPWDLQAADIRYLPRPDADQPQKFVYATRIGFGLDIRGQGESVGSRRGPGGQHTSALSSGPMMARALSAKAPDIGSISPLQWGPK